jgi:hypothetical protein
VGGRRPALQGEGRVRVREFIENLLGDTEEKGNLVEFRLDTPHQQEIVFVGVAGPGSVGKGKLTVMFAYKPIPKKGPR